MIKIRASYLNEDELRAFERTIQPYICKRKAPPKVPESAYYRVYYELEMHATKPEKR